MFTRLSSIEVLNHAIFVETLYNKHIGRRLIRMKDERKREGENEKRINMQ